MTKTWKCSLAVIANAPSQYVITGGKWGSPNIAVVDSEENARLIAAAPDLLKFLKLVCSHADHIKDERLQTIIDGALVVITKAEGK